MNDKYYSINQDHELTSLPASCIKVRDEINKKKPVDGDLWQTIEEKILVE